MIDSLLTGVPEEVVWFNIFPYLCWNDLLRLRRVCKSTKAIVMGYVKAYPDKAPELEIKVDLEDEGGMGLKAFMESGMVTTKVYFNNEHGCSMWVIPSYKKWSQQRSIVEEEYYRRFLRTHGPVIKSLRVDTLSLFIYGKERTFYETLVNLKSLEAKQFGDGVGFYLDRKNYGKYWQYTHRRRMAREDSRFNAQFCPSTFLKLKHLKIGNEDEGGKELIHNLIACTHYYTQNGHQLETLALPFNDKLVSGWYESQKMVPELLVNAEVSQVLALAFQLLEIAVGYGAQRNGNAGLKVISLENHCKFMRNYQRSLFEREVMENTASPQFLQLCITCLQFDVKLANVRPTWFKRRRDIDAPEEWESPVLGNVVLSLIGFTPEVLQLEMPNLERIEIAKTSEAILPPGQQRPVWPALKSLEICVDSTEVTWEDENADLVVCSSPFFIIRRANPIIRTLKTDHLLNFFFKNVHRPALVELRLKFCEDAKYVAIPNTRDIVNACPNLKKLWISNWRGTNKELRKLWSGLPNLQELTLESCRKLKMDAFIGKDEDWPCFLKLTKLRKLSLLGLDQMPKITDALLSQVICHMSLTHFTITSTLKNGVHVPIHSLTFSGLLSLLTGQFANSIEHFPFSGWSLAGVSSEEMTGLERKFRSYRML